MSLIRNTLKQDAYWKINKRLVIELGIEATVVLTDIIEKYYYYLDERKALLREDKYWFFYRSEDIKSTFGLGYKVQKRILLELSDRVLIENKLFTSPAKLHITINEKNIEILLNSSFTKTANLDLSKRQNQFDPNDETYKEQINKGSLSIDKELLSDLENKFSEHNTTQRKKVPAKKESKPALLMRDSIQVNLDAVKFSLFGTMYEKANIEFYYEAALAWSDSKQQKSKDWLATIRNFMLRDMKAGNLVIGELSQEEKLSTVKDIMENWENI